MELIFILDNLNKNIILHNIYINITLKLFYYLNY
jgi:hypothetical protein